MSIERLKSLVGRSDFCGRTSHADWEAVTKWLGHPLPHSYTDLLDCFGHGVWGRELILLHPLAARWQQLSLTTLMERRKGIDPEFRSKYMAGDISAWDFIPVSLLPVREDLLVGTQAGQVTFYDGDCCEATETGLSIPDFLYQSICWKGAKLPHVWQEFSECNWPANGPIFAPSTQADLDGIWALYS